MNRYYNPTELRIASESQIRAEFPLTCFPVPFVPPAGWFRLYDPQVMPEYDPIRQRLVDNTPTFTSGIYQANYVASDYPTSVQDQRLSAEVDRLTKMIDRDVDDVYARVIGNRTVEYQMAYDEAKEWVNGGYVGVPPPSVQAHVDGYGISAEDSAAEIIAVGDQWYALVRQLREARLRAKGLARQYRFAEAQAYWTSVMQAMAAA